MTMTIFQEIRSAVTILVILTALTGGVYPLVVTILAQTIYPGRANGSLMARDNRTIGSEHIGQSFNDPKYFWGRLSATSPMPYNAAASTGSNYGPMHPQLLEQTRIRLEELAKAGSASGDVPVDLVTSSASGLDPHISPAAAEYQANRVATVRGIETEQVRSLIQECTERRQWGLLGEPRVHVLRLNLALDDLSPIH